MRQTRKPDFRRWAGRRESLRRSSGGGAARELLKLAGYEGAPPEDGSGSHELCAEEQDV